MTNENKPVKTIDDVIQRLFWVADNWESEYEKMGKFFVHHLSVMCEIAAYELKTRRHEYN